MTGSLMQKPKLKPKVKKKGVLDKSLSAILNQLKINRDYDIPYTAGYNKKGTVIYIDKDMPSLMPVNKNKSQNITKFLVLHEVIEKALIKELGHIHYQFAHEIAFMAEKEAVKREGINTKKYDKFMDRYIKKNERKKLVSVPKDLDLKPYQDEKDTKTLAKIKQAKKKNK